MTQNPNKLSRFLQELRRRRVIQVIIVYATAAFMILEAVDMVFPRLNFPDWTVTFVMILLAIGFPLAIIFSWIFDYTPKGIMKTRSLEEIKTPEVDAETADLNKEQSVLWSRIIPWSLTLIVAAALLVLWIFRWNNGSDNLPVIRSVHVLPDGEVLRSDDPGAALAFSPDGTNIVYVAYRNKTSFLYKKKIDEFGAEEIEGTEGGYAPFFSPDGNRVGFFADGRMKKVSINGGAPQLICDTYPGHEGCWGEDNMIVYCDFFRRALWQVSADGGSPGQLTTAMKWSNEDIEDRHSWPSYLPGSKNILFTIRHNADDMRVAVFSTETGETKTLIEPGTHATYLRTGHLLYAWKGDLLAVRFDLNRLETIGDPVIVLQDVMMNPTLGLAHFSVSDQGSLAFLTRKYKSPQDSVFLMDREGNFEALPVPAGVYQSPVFSPDGENLILTRLQEKASIWIYGLERGNFRRFTDKNFESYWAIWTPDSKEVVYNSNRHGGDRLSLFVKRLDGGGAVRQITQSNFNQQPKTWLSDGVSLIYLEYILGETGYDIYMINTTGNDTPVPLINSRSSETHPNLSPDGKWLAYVSDEPGQDEVFICSFPDLGQLSQISIDEGTEPVWDPDGKSLYYRDQSGDKIMRVFLETEPVLDPGKPTIMFEGRFKPGYPYGRNFDISPDGQHFLMIKEESSNETAQMNIIYNWSEELAGFFD